MKTPTCPVCGTALTPMMVTDHRQHSQLADHDPRCVSPLRLIYITHLCLACPDEVGASATPTPLRRAA